MGCDFRVLAAEAAVGGRGLKIVIRKQFRASSVPVGRGKCLFLPDVLSRWKANSYHLMQQTNFVGGCLFGNTALEMTDSNSQFGRIIQEVSSQWTDRIEHELRQAEEAAIPGEQALPPGVLATAVVAILEGGIMLSRVYNNKKSMEECILAIRSLIGCQN